MPKLHPRWFVWLMLAGCPPENDDSAEEASVAGEDGKFACGANGGTCQADELCILGGSDMCSTCVPLPAACDGDATCDCIPPGTDAMWGTSVCEDAGTCATVEGGRVLTCADVQWGCG